ncbi:MFS transporter [Solirubrobacter ginsenosidimutans]|uniref:MFS transporter n=1 Tax=Solirubrobacter ginsenosidimutans TaxID=490573 RepID=A0A9X3N878_9ACTN|nr:MFS transporter [Solirubrobacter ginsenosidimutans]MDA0166643.1 MFS transporter [Solirubrobacter ginsenosidimutans]
MNLKEQPKAVWAVAFACVIAFMGIGLVDPILPVLAKDLEATPSQVSLLFTSYFAITGVSMLVTGFVSSRIGPRKTLLAGLILVIAFAALAGASGSIPEIVGFRAGWGLGNALFIATALAVIMGSATGGVGGAIILYEAALGLGIASGPLLGGILGGISWRGPFFGTAVLMAIAFVAILVLLEEIPKPARKVGLTEPLRALRHRGLLITGLVALFYNFGFFTLLAYTPFPLQMGAHALGAVFFGWGLLLAFTSVFVAPRLKRRFGVVATLGAMYAALALILAVMGFGEGTPALLAVLVIGAGAVLGVVNTVLTESVMRIAPVERPIASSAYSFVRFAGGAVAPWLAGKLAEWVSPSTPFFVGAGAVVVALLVLLAGRAYFVSEEEIEVEIAPPLAAPVLVAVDGSPRGIVVTAAAAKLAAERGAAVEVLHVHETDDEDAVQAVLDRIDAIGAQAIVVGRRGRVAERARVPVMVVPA